MSSDRFRPFLAIPMLVALMSLLTGLRAQAAEISFLEQFALAPDRSVALAELIPGTEDFYYYHALQYQHLQQFNRVDELLKVWTERFRDSQRIREIRARQSLLLYDRDSQRTLQFLRSRLGLNFDHQRETVDRASQLPTRLDPALIERDRLLRLALERHNNLNGIEDRALVWLAAAELTGEQRRELLQRIVRPDIDGIVSLVLADLRSENRIPFGSHPIHAQLLRAQLEELIGQEPSLLNQQAFVNIYLSKLTPPPDEDWRNDLAAREAYLDELASFVSRLSEAHNSLKAHVLYHRLALDVQRGQFDKSRLLTYLKLPRPADYVNPRYLAEPQHRRFAANLQEDFHGQTALPPVGSDEAVVRRYLAHFFIEADSYREFEPYVRDTYLRELFAETKVVNQLGNPEQWASWLSSEAYQRLRDRVDLEFAPSNPRVFAMDEPVALDLYVKHVPTLIVKVYQINAVNYYRDQAEHVNTAINLDGLVPNSETTTELQESPFHRVRRHLSFPELTEPGVYVIDLIGNGKSSRALIHKGQLRQVMRPTAAGYAFTVLDERGKPLRDAQIWMAGRTYTAQRNGEILIPYSTQPQQQPIILLHEKLATLDGFFHGAESYELQAGIYVDRESLRSRREMPLVIRPALLLSGTPISVGAIEEPRLEVTAVDMDGVHTTSTFSDVTLHDDRETIQPLRVPPRLSQLTVTLKGRVQSLSENRPVDVAASASFQINAIEKTPAIDQLELVPTQDGYVIEVLGKTGEPKPNRPVRIELKHRDFRDEMQVVLRSDASGRIHLGPLHEIERVVGQIGEYSASSWHLDANSTKYDDVIHVVTGQTIEIPIASEDNAQPDRMRFSLLEVRGQTFVEDRFEHIAIRRGAIVVEDLDAGDYDLWLVEQQRRILLRVTDGQVSEGHAISPTRTLQLSQSAPPRIVAVQLQDGKASIELEHATPETRVHLLASYFHPAFDPFRQFSSVDEATLRRSATTTLPSLYVQGRTIGDELRYILERRYATKYPGNMLDRPELLLNPWDVRDTQTAHEQLAEGDDFADQAPPAAPAAAEPGSEARGVEAPSDFENLDYLAADPLIELNLRPNEQGRIELDVEHLAGRTVIYAVLVDPQTVQQRTAYLSTAERVHEDLRLAQGLDPEAHFALTKQTSVFEEGQTIMLGNLGSGRFQLYDSLPRVYQLYETLLPGSHLADFRFLLEWRGLGDEQKREQYSKYACHELNFFLLQKDPEFFEAVVRPYLQHKLHKTFLDDYLIGNDLRAYLSPWNYEQLNTVERILLARRIDGELPYTLDHLQSKWAVIPTDQNRLNFLFDTALLGQALEKRILLEQEQLGRSFFDVRAGIVAGAVKAPALEERLDSAAQWDKLSAARRRPLSRDAANGAVPVQRGAEQMVQDLAFRENAAARRLYQPLDKTKEWAESNYYRLPIEQQNADLVTVNDLWLDYIRHGEKGGFRSVHFPQVRNFTEAMFALAVLDLPDTSPEHATEVVDQALRVRTSGPVIVLHEQLEPATTGEQSPPVLISQNFFRFDDRYSMVDGVRVDRFVGGEFLYQTVYGCQLVVTNPTSSQQTLDVLTQLPTGALPVQGAKLTQTFRLQLQPYQTQPIEYLFYFPHPGDFVQFPAHVTKDRQLVAAAEPAAFHVVTELSEIDRQAWDFVSQHGTDQDVLTFLRERNLQTVNLDLIAFRMGDLEFFESALATLRSRHVYNHTLWSYSVLHNDRAAMGEFLDHAQDLIQECGELLVGPLMAIDPIARKTYEHLEYHPLVNARVHQINHPRQIFNDRLHWQYHRWLKLVGYMRQLDDQSRLVTVYYLLLQDRLDEAIEHFKLIDPSDVATRLQYDYCRAYLSMSQGDTSTARSVAAAYESYPVERWRDAFAVVLNHLNEIEGPSSIAVDPTHRNQAQDQLASDSPTFEFRVQDKHLRLQYRNLDRITVRYYLMDIELLFSRHPFVERHMGQFAYIAPNLTETIELSEVSGQLEKPLPEELLHQNVLIEIEGAGLRQSQPYYSNALAVQLVENYGQLRVTHQDTHQPISTVYCKVYALQNDGSTVFYKDGYTDLRGRFDYATLSTDQLDRVERFAILVLSEDAGATVREAEPPKR